MKNLVNTVKDYRISKLIEGSGNSNEVGKMTNKQVKRNQESGKTKTNKFVVDNYFEIR